MRAVILALILVAGCAAPQITIPTGQAALFYAQARADYATAKLIIVQGCVGGKIDKASCDALTVIDTRAQTLRQSVERSLADTSQPVDWSMVMSYASSVGEMLLRLGILAAK